MTFRIDHVVTSGKFELDGGSWDVDNNIWIVGDEHEVVIIDVAHSAEPIVDAVAGRTVRAIVATHGHNDHITVAPELSERLDAPVLLHPGDDMLWRETHPDAAHGDIEDQQRIPVAGTELVLINTVGTLAGVVLPVPARGGRALQRRHPVLGRARRHRTITVLELPDHHLLDPGAHLHPRIRVPRCGPVTVIRRRSARRPRTRGVDRPRQLRLIVFGSSRCRGRVGPRVRCGEMAQSSR